MIFNEKLTDTLLAIFDHILHNELKTNPGNWFVGITTDPEKREIQLETKIKMNYFKSWNLADKENAIILKTFLIEKGAKKGITILPLKTNSGDFIQNSMDTHIFVFKTNV